MASRTALGNDSNSLTSTSPENLEALPPSGHSDSSRSWGCGRGAEGFSAFQVLLHCLFCSVVIAVAMASLPPPLPPGLPEGQLQVPEDSWDSGASLKYLVHLSVVPQNVSNSSPQNQRQPSLACSARSFISYPPLLFIAPHPADWGTLFYRHTLLGTALTSLALSPVSSPA